MWVWYLHTCLCMEAPYSTVLAKRDTALKMHCNTASCGPALRYICLGLDLWAQPARL